MSNNPVVHFEMPYKDPKRVAEFYSTVFGWKMEVTAPEMGGYILAGTIESDENGQPKNAGGINGGFYDVNASQASPVPSVVISVGDLKKAMEGVKAASGEILSEPQEIPGVGLWAVFKDSEGNRVSLLQPRNQ